MSLGSIAMARPKVVMMALAIAVALMAFGLMAQPGKAEAACWISSPLFVDKTPKTNMPGGGWVYGQVRVEALPTGLLRGTRTYCVNGDVNTFLSARVDKAYWGIYLYVKRGSGGWSRQDSRAWSCNDCWGGGGNTKAVGAMGGHYVKADGVHKVKKGTWRWNRSTQAVGRLP